MATVCCGVPFAVRGSKQRAMILGLVADTQYADAEPAIGRYYREAAGKLEEAVDYFNGQEMNACINLGDLVDRSWDSFDKPLGILKRSKHRFYHLLGNHDFEVEDGRKPGVPKRLGLRRRYYSVGLPGFRLVMLDTNDVSTYAHPRASEEHGKAAMELARLAAAGAKNAQSWNGGVGAGQLRWFQQVCRNAKRNREKVIVFAHHPVYPPDKHNLWNSEAMLEQVRESACIVAWINGHNHGGHFGTCYGVPFVTLKGMVDTPAQNAFARARLFSDRIELTGHGREESRELVFRTD